MAPSMGAEQAGEMKHRMEEMWTKSAAAYAEWVIDNHFLTGLYPRFADWLVPQLQGRAARILDLASASGEPAATLAEALPEAEVVSTDLAAPYLELGRARAARQGLNNISFETADAEDLHRYADASFDAVCCSLGLMFLPSHEKALAEIVRVLKPGGLFACSVWSTEERVPFFKVVKDVTAEYDPSVVQASSFAVRFGNPAANLVPDMEAAGLQGVEVATIDVQMSMPAHVWWTGMLGMPLPLQPALAKVAETRGLGVFEEAKAKMAAVLRANGWLTEDDALLIRENSCHFITARKP